MLPLGRCSSITSSGSRARSASRHQCQCRAPLLVVAHLQQLLLLGGLGLPPQCHLASGRAREVVAVLRAPGPVGRLQAREFQQQ